VRDEGAAVHMAHAHAALSGPMGVCLATARPGVSNSVTVITHAHLERVPVLLIDGCAPVLQVNLGPLRGTAHAAIMAPVPRSPRTLRKVLAPNAVTIADGGDLLSVVRMGLETRHDLDADAVSCLGVGTPYAVAAALLHPGRQVEAGTGDGAFGIHAMAIDTAQRHVARAVSIVSNNAAWNIERRDQAMNYGGHVVGTTLAWSDYAGMARAFGLHAKCVPDRQALTAWDEAEQERRR
jgi:thiamine pyrophosphate-dependent acetolactate synthase large subunit-like protein